MRKRIAELDILRAVAAVAVVMIHVTALPMVTLPVDSRSFFYNSLINQWSRFSIPAFVLITGIVLFWGYGDRERFHTGQFLVRRLKAIAIPYLVWTVIYLVWRDQIGQNWREIPSNLIRFLIEGTGMYQLYFIVLIFQFYLLFPLVRNLGKGRWLGLVLVAALVFQGALMWDTFYGLFTQRATAPWALGVLRWRDRLFPWWIGYFIAGAWIAAHLDQLLTLTRRWLWPLLGAATGLLTWMMLEYMQIMTNGGAVGFAATGFRPTAYLYSLVAILALLGFGRWVIERDGPSTRLFLALGNQSFGIFLVHPLILDITLRLLRPFSMTPLLHLILVSSVVLLGSYLTSRSLSTLPFGRWVVGS